uniref:hypothetical protein n=1 Tax=Haloprofundus sp. MHR1 TaxID=2572921 RepID=UPI001F24E891|nr:hypothetical protein [Haloprofundus sp. MHR1]
MVEYCVCGAVGLALTTVLALAFYSRLAAVAEPLGLLSSTAIVFAILSMWLLLWVVFGSIWEWRAGRLGLSEPPRG